MHRTRQSVIQRGAQLLEMRERYHAGCPVCNQDGSGWLASDFRACRDGSVEAQIGFGKEHEGYIGYVHGGLISTALDGAMTNCLFSHGVAGVTGELKVRLLHPVTCGTKMVVNAQVERSFGPLHTVSAELCAGGRVFASAHGKFVALKGYKT